MKRITLNTDDLVARYLAGESENGLAHSYGVSRGVIRRYLIECGVNPRTQSESETVKWSRMSPDARRDQVSAAHFAVRGSTQTVEHRTRIAETVQANADTHATNDEVRLAGWIRDRGIDPVLQQQVGPYNCDIGAFPIAVEIFGGNWHWSGRHAARMEKRFRYFFDSGWHIAVVHVPVWSPISETAADYVVSWHKSASGNPSAVREYRMIRGGTEALTVADADSDHIPVVFPLRSTRDVSSGRYKSVPR